MKIIKKLILLLMVAFIAIIVSSSLGVVIADSNSTSEMEESLTEIIGEQLNNMDFSYLDNILADLDLEAYSAFGDSSFLDKINSIINGEFSEGYTDIFSAIVNVFLSGIISFVPLLAIIVGIAVMSSFVSGLSPSGSDKSVSDVVHFVCYALIIILVFNAVVEVITLTGDTLNSLKTQMDVAFPILLTIMTALGSVVSVSVYQPAIAIFSSGIMQIFNSVIMPIFIFTLVFSVVGNISSSIKLKKFSEFFNSSFKWIVGSIFTVFMGFMSIQGITAGSYDTVSIKTAKFAMRSYIPIVGGYLSEGINVIMASGILVKNSVGLAGLILMFVTILSPVIKILILKFGFNLTAAILEPIVDNRISNFLMAVSKTLVMLLVTILVISFMYFIMVGLIICTGNVL